MSTPPPNHHGDHMKSSQVNNMAATAAVKTKPASKAGATATATAAAAAAANKQKSQMHRRSRTGLSPRFPRCRPSRLSYSSVSLFLLSTHPTRDPRC